jgi:hypothetical protein
VCGTPFFPRVLKHLVGLDHPVPQPPLIAESPGRLLEPVTEREQLLAVAAQLAGELGGGHPLGDPADDKDQFGGPPPGPLQEGTGEGVEHPPAGQAAVVEHRIAVAAMDGQVLALGAPRAGQSAGVEPTDEPLVAGAFVHQIGDGEIHGRLRIEDARFPVISDDRGRGIKRLAPTSPHEPKPFQKSLWRTLQQILASCR